MTLSMHPISGSATVTGEALNPLCNAPSPRGSDCFLLATRSTSALQDMETATLSLNRFRYTKQCYVRTGPWRWCCLVRQATS